MKKNKAALPPKCCMLSLMSEFLGRFKLYIMVSVLPST